MTLISRLLGARNQQGHWTGELSSSALSTATAVIALHLAKKPKVQEGLDWLERTQNPDGGFGDTILSLSNISTTALCWAAFKITNRPNDKVEAWMKQTAGSLDPIALKPAIERRYGKDQTFSVPILTVLAVAGLIPWKLVPQLPFELAAFPQSMFRFLQLPVVSYALPALIAIGHVKHKRSNSFHPIRQATAAKTLKVLAEIQPPNGGFLEATPLTSFVTISLLAAGYHNEVIEKGLTFLDKSAREDGSWPIDTNLATWVTTLSVNALKHHLPQESRNQIRDWLLNQQYKIRHPYTGADPGGWAWTDLPGGVPDSDDTSGALLALSHLGTPDAPTIEAVKAGANWLKSLQNRDGGIPTFCRGWGTLPFDRSSPDITAHALQAWLAWKPHVEATQATAKAIAFLKKVQRPDGAWIPLWFGNQHAPNDENPLYGTARVLAAMKLFPEADDATKKAKLWLLHSQNDDGGWGGNHNIPSSIEETALAITALQNLDGVTAAIDRAKAWLEDATRNGTPPSPIGFYFARLWYFETLYPLIFSTEALSHVDAGKTTYVKSD